MLTRDFKFRVWYKDTDQMGIVHHSNYICYYLSLIHISEPTRPY